MSQETVPTHELGAIMIYNHNRGEAVFPGGSDGKASACSVGDLGSIPGLGRSSGEGNGYPHQYSCLENSMDRGAWQATVHGIAKSWTQLSNLHFHFQRLKTDKVFRCL